MKREEVNTAYSSTSGDMLQPKITITAEELLRDRSKSRPPRRYLQNRFMQESRKSLIYFANYLRALIDHPRNHLNEGCAQKNFRIRVLCGKYSSATNNHGCPAGPTVYLRDECICRRPLHRLSTQSPADIQYDVSRKTSVGAILDQVRQMYPRYPMRHAHLKGGDRWSLAKDPARAKEAGALETEVRSDPAQKDGLGVSGRRKVVREEYSDS